jgi:hypothetical protein
MNPSTSRPVESAVNFRRSVGICWCVVVAFIGLIVTPALGQTESPKTDLASTPIGEVGIDLLSFGVGGSARPGDWAGIALSLSDAGSTQREAIIRVSLRDADRDTAMYERVITLNPGTPQTVWLYARLPGWLRTGELLAVDVFEAIEAQAADTRVLAVNPGRSLGQLRTPIPRLMPRTTGLIGVVGGRTMGLGELSGQSIAGESIAARRHEVFEIASGLSPEQLPDQSHGLSSFSVLAWNDPPPARLGLERARAVREWVLSGGHLIVSLPRVGQTWTDEINNPLFDLIPLVRVERREDVDLGPQWRLLARRDERPSLSVPGPVVPMPTKQVLHVLRPIEGREREVSVILASADGEPLVVRRAVGLGAVTLIGLDLSSPAMASAGLPDPNIFWNRVLGVRGESIGVNELRELQNQSALQSGESITLDRGISGEIAKTGRSAVGVLLGFVVFALYWVVAGPGGFGLLRWKGLTRFAWLAFLASAIAFTALAWGGATLLRTRTPESAHLSIIQHVYGQPVQRARGWFSVLLPTYGDEVLRIGTPDATLDAVALASGPGGGSLRLSPWEALDTSGPDAGFPDARGYRINATRPDALVVPARATVKLYQADWTGPTRWKMPRPWLPPEAAGEPTLTLLPRAGTLDQPQVRGALVHELPGPMREVVIVVNRGQRTLQGERGSLAHALAYAYKLTGEWPAGEPLDLAPATSKAIGLSYFEELLGGLGASDSDQLDFRSDGVIGRLVAMALLGQLAVPSIERNTATSESRHARRTMTHGFDLSRWFTQPSLIILGTIGGADAATGGPSAEASAGPIPLTVGGSNAGGGTLVRSSGRTLVMWVYPFPDRPPAHAATIVEQDPN